MSTRFRIRMKHHPGQRVQNRATHCPKSRIGQHITRNPEHVGQYITRSPEQDSTLPQVPNRILLHPKCRTGQRITRSIQNRTARYPKYRTAQYITRSPQQDSTLPQVRNRPVHHLGQRVRRFCTSSAWRWDATENSPSCRVHRSR